MQKLMLAGRWTWLELAGRAAGRLPGSKLAVAFEAPLPLATTAPGRWGLIAVVTPRLVPAGGGTVRCRAHCGLVAEAAAGCTASVLGSTGLWQWPWHWYWQWGLRVGPLSFGAARDVMRCDAMRCSLTNTSRRPNQFLCVLVRKQGTPVLGCWGCWLAQLTSSVHCLHCNGPVFAASALSANAAGSPPRWLFVWTPDSQAPGSFFGMLMKAVAFPLSPSLCARRSSRWL